MSTSSSKNMEKMCELLSKEVESKERGKGKKDWLELALGFGSDDSSNLMMMHGSSSSASASQLPSSSPFPPQSSQQGQRIALGSRIVFDNEELNNSGNDHGLCSRNDHLPFSASPFMFCKSTTTLQGNSCSSNFHDYHGLSRPVPNVSNHYVQRPSPGLWFTLRSTTNRDGEVLPQIPKAYIRVKDANLTVLMVKTYLVRKLGLSNEAEVEVSCMGQILSHSQTMKDVRDAIWLPKLVEFLNSNPTLVADSQSVQHLMSLDYGKSCFSKEF